MVPGLPIRNKPVDNINLPPLTCPDQAAAARWENQRDPGRIRTLQGVAAWARSLAPVLGADADLLEAAGWLHDIGCASAGHPGHGPQDVENVLQSRRV
jgi:HD domain